MIGDFVSRLPKAELHVHIEGTLEPEMMFEKAARHGVALPYADVQALRAAYNFRNLQEFLDLYYTAAKVLRTADDFYDLTWAYLQRARADHVVHAEIFVDPQTHTARGIDLQVVFEGIVEALRDGQAMLGMTWRLIPNFLRHLSEQDAFDCLNALEPHLQYCHGFGLDSSELGHPPEKFSQLFAVLRERGFPVVAHAGEEGPASYVWESLNSLKVTRIDHGIRAIEDDALVQELVRRQVALTVCPLSNQRLCATPDLTRHPLKRLLEAGVKVTVNSDDPAYFGGYINANYVSIAHALEISTAQLRTLAANSIEASWLDESTKAMHLYEIAQVPPT